MVTQIFKIGALQQKLFWLLFGFLLLMIFSYIYLINNLIFTVADRETLLGQRDQLILTMGALEGQSFALAKTITVDRAYNLGFEEARANNTAFVAISRPQFAQR